MKKTLIFTALGVFLLLGLSSPAGAKEAAPVLYRTAPIIPWAKQIGEHRFRSPRNYDDTIKYYGKIFRGNKQIQKRKIINSSAVRAVHYKNLRPNGRWEGFNVYEHKQAAWIFVVFSDKELAKIAKEKSRKSKPKKTKRRKK